MPASYLSCRHITLRSIFQRLYYIFITPYTLHTAITIAAGAAGYFVIAITGYCCYHAERRAWGIKRA